MKIQILAALVGASLTAGAVAKKPFEAEIRQIRTEAALQKVMDAAPAAVDESGDAASFNRPVKFIGLMNSGQVILAADCTIDPAFPPGPDDHCFVTTAAPGVTTFNVPDVARMVVPGKTANSLFCHWQTSVVSYTLHNPTAGYMPNGRFVVTPSYTFQNVVLNDPALINPQTGAPFGGTLTVSLPGIRHARGLQPSEFQTERENLTRACIAGLISKRGLVEGFGLTETQATNFFKNDTVITMNLQGSSSLVNFASIIYGTRFVAD